MSDASVGVSAPDPVLRELYGLRRSLWLERTAHAAWLGLRVGMLVLVVAEVVLRIARTSVDVSLTAAALPLVAVLGVVVWKVIRAPTLGQAARVADRRLGLRGQLSTAFELSQSELSPFGAAQMTRCVLAAREARLRSPEPVRRWMALLLCSICVAVAAGGAALIAQDWLRTIDLPVFPGQRLRSDTSESAPPAAEGHDLPDALQQIVQQADEGDAPSLASAQQALADKTAQSRATQQALSNLATALQQTSAGQAAADALNRGDYASAVNDISQLGQNSDQLSPDARAALSKSLQSAAQSASVLSDREARAGQALHYQSYTPAQQSLQNLADSVNKASQSVLSQEQLSAAWQQLEAAQRRAQSQANQAPRSPQGAAAPGDTGPSQLAAGGPPGQTNEAAGGRGESSGRFDPGSRTDLTAAGVPVDVPLQMSAGPSRLTQSGAEQPEIVHVVSDPASVGGGSSTSGGAQATRAERNFVPAELRPVVRDYFGNGPPPP